MGSSGDAFDAADDRMFPGGGVVDVADDTRRQAAILVAAKYFGGD